MTSITNRFLWIISKWILAIAVIYYLWTIKFFVFVFFWIPWMISYEFSLILEFGLQPTLRYHGMWWMIAGFSFCILILTYYLTTYRHTRRGLMIGGEFDARVVWIKGIRQGLIYDVWDFKNYVQWKLGKKKDGESPTINSNGNMVVVRGTWPDPWAIPIGERNDKDYVIYFKRRWLQIFPDKVLVSRKYDVMPTFFYYLIPNLRMIRQPHRDRPGRWVYRLVDEEPDMYEIHASEITAENRKLLGRSQVYVSWAIRSDSETQKKDYTTGSLPIAQLQKKDTEFD